MLKNFNKILFLVILPLILINIVFLSFAKPAYAETEGCTGFGKEFTVNGIGFTQGMYCVYIHGQGHYVSNVVGHFGNIGTVCNWDITAEFFDSKGSYITTYPGQYHGNCTADAWDTINVNWQMSSDGLLCSTLKSNGSRITSVCNSIHQ